VNKNTRIVIHQQVKIILVKSLVYASLDTAARKYYKATIKKQNREQCGRKYQSESHTQILEVAAAIILCSSAHKTCALKAPRHTHIENIYTHTPLIHSIVSAMCKISLSCSLFRLLIASHASGAPFFHCF
jgi:hypothetical protein